MVTQATNELPPRLNAELEAQERTVAWLARRGRIHSSYALRMLKGERPLTADFRAVVEAALGVPAAELFAPAPTEAAE